eukprot:1159459-Pelagomonas_calceolata.AAC.8
MMWHGQRVVPNSNVHTTFLQSMQAVLYLFQALTSVTVEIPRMFKAAILRIDLPSASISHHHQLSISSLISCFSGAQLRQ